MEESNTSSRKYKVFVAILSLVILALLFWLFIQRSQLLKMIKAKEA